MTPAEEEAEIRQWERRITRAVYVDAVPMGELCELLRAMWRAAREMEAP